MSRRVRSDDAWDDAWDEVHGDDDHGDLDDGDLDDGDNTLPCPYCQRPIYADAPRCPYCENYLSEEEDVSAPRKPWWIVIGVGVCLYLVYRWTVGR